MSSIDEFADADSRATGTPPRQGVRAAASRAMTLQRLRLFLLILGPVAVLAGIGYLYITGGRYVSTDDASIQTPRTWISTDIPGRVVEIDIHDNQLVQKGQILFRLGPRQYQYAVDRARGQLGSARLKVLALKASYQRHLAELKSAEDNTTYALRERERETNLSGSGIVSKSQLDVASHAVDTATQQVSMMQQQIAEIVADLGGDPDIPIDRHPSVMEAQAVLDRAQFDLANTVVTAPETGVVSKTEQLQLGDFVTAATPLFSLVPQRVWVEADFKETELTYMRPGQKATVTIDTYPGRKFSATVSSLSPGTGSTFSILPPENATGNWIKVVQRVPVRLNLDDVDQDTPLHAGLSAVVEVDTRHHRDLPTYLSWMNGALGRRS